MKTTLPSLCAALLAALVASGCGQARQQGKPGQVKVAFKANAHSPSSASLTMPALCADVTLAPSSLDANGHATPAGAPVVLTKAGAAAGTLSIAGCIDSIQSTTTPATPDWQYLVTATNIGPCDPTQTLPGVPSPSVVTSVLDLDCQAGKDISANVEIDVSIPVPNSGGYVDISATVNATDVEVGCKEADRDSRDPSLLNFGMSQTGATQAALSDAILGAGGSSTPKSQFQSQLHAGQGYMQFFTGQFAFHPGFSFQQSLVGPCAPGTEFHGASTPTCSTSVGEQGGVTTTAQLTTATSIGDALAAWVDLSADGQLSFNTSAGSTDLLHPSATASSLSASNQTTQQTVGAPAPCARYSGVWPSNQDAGKFVATCSDAAGNTYWTTLSFDGSSWSAAAAQPLSGASGLTTSEMSCLGLFGSNSQATCAAPTGEACVPVTRFADAGIEVLFATHFVKGESRLELAKSFEALNFSSARVAAAIDAAFAAAPNVRLNGTIVALGRAAIANDAKAYLAGVNDVVAKVASAGPITVEGFNGLIGKKMIGPWFPIPFGGTVGGSILGLTGSGLVLASPGQTNLSKAAGSTSFVFGASQGGFTPYAVTVQTQPAGQTCVVTNGAGTLISTITNVVVACGPQSWAKIATAQNNGGISSYTLGIASDGTLWSWGDNTHGSLGLGDNLPRSIPTQVGTATWTEVSAGFDTAFAIKSDGTLWAWGGNSMGQLGDGTTVDTNTPHQVGTGNGWTSIAGGFWLAVGIQGGALYQWGSGTLAPQQVGVDTDWARVTAPFFGRNAIKTNGTLWFWGGNTVGVTPSVLPTQFGTSTWLYAATNWNHTLLIRADHTLWSIGYGWYGALGTGVTDMTNTVYPLTQIGTAADWTAVAVGSRGGAGLRGASGDLYTWGWNTTGNLGDGTTVSSVSPQAAPVATGFTSIALYANETYAIKSTGELWGWGANNNNTLGLGAATGITTTPHQLP
jgi:alpha-tubulin suppressor-like RCC1 family protein